LKVWPFARIKKLRRGPASDLTTKVERLEHEVARFQKNCDALGDYYSSLVTVSEIWVPKTLLRDFCVFSSLCDSIV